VRGMIDQGVHEVMIKTATSSGVSYVALSKAIKML
jgi:hypothetical protein